MNQSDNSQPLPSILDDIGLQNQNPVDLPTSSTQQQSKKPSEGKGKGGRRVNEVNASVPFESVKPFVNGMNANGLTYVEISHLIGASDGYVSNAEHINKISNIGAAAIKLLHENLRLKALSKNSVDKKDLLKIYTAIYGKPGMDELQKMLHKMLE